MSNSLRQQSTAHGGPSILIVEDDADTACRLQSLLKDPKVPLTAQGCGVDITRDIQGAREFLRQDIVDIYIVDLIMPDSEGTAESALIGKAFVREINEKSNAGIIVHSSLPAEIESTLALDTGADDYIHKYPPTQDERIPQMVRSRVRAVWRRIQLLRPMRSNLFAHTNRVFLLGNWRFVVGDRSLTSTAGESIRLSPTEHAFLRYLCTVEDHQVDVDTFNSEILGRKDDDRHPRLDNVVYRIREKIGEAILLSKRGGVYKLIDVQELRPQ
jgi:DNA-binding response OmpR family regulator